MSTYDKWALGIGTALCFIGVVYAVGSLIYGIFVDRVKNNN